MLPRKFPEHSPLRQAKRPPIDDENGSMELDSGSESNEECSNSSVSIQEDDLIDILDDIIYADSNAFGGGVAKHRQLDQNLLEVSDTNPNNHECIFKNLHYANSTFGKHRVSMERKSQGKQMIYRLFSPDLWLNNQSWPLFLQFVRSFSGWHATRKVLPIEGIDFNATHLDSNHAGDYPSASAIVTPQAARCVEQRHCVDVYFNPQAAIIQGMYEYPSHTMSGIQRSGSKLQSKPYHHQQSSKGYEFVIGDKEDNKKSAPKRAGSSSRRHKLKDVDLPKRPCSSFIFFNKDRREMIRNKFPGKTFGDLTKEIGAAFKALSAQEKQPYIELSEKDKKRYAAEMKAYAKKWSVRSSDGSKNEENSIDEEQM